MKRLSPKQQDVLYFIERYKEREEVAPSVREIGAKFGISPRAALDRLRALERKGYVRRTRGRARAIRVIYSSSIETVKADFSEPRL